MEKFFKHPWVIVGVVTIITLFFSLQLPRIEMNNNMNAFLPDDNPVRKVGKHLEEEYGEEIAILIGLERPYGTVFDGLFLSRMRDYIDAAESIALVKGTNSLVSAQYLTADSESIIVTDLVEEDFSGTPQEVAELKRRIASWDLYQGALVSDDLSSTQIVVTLRAPPDKAGDPEVVAVLTRLRDMAKDMFSGYANVYTTGQPVISATISEASKTDVMLLVPFVIAVLLTVLILSFRRLSYVLFPLLTVIVATIWAVGAIIRVNLRRTENTHLREPFTL